MTPLIFKSLAEAVEAYYDELLRFARKRTGSDMLAEDVMQDTWVRASKTSVVMPDNPRAYLYRMTGNIAIDHLRKRQSISINEGHYSVENVHDDNSWGGGDWPEPDAQSPADSQTAGVEDVVIAQQELAILVGAVKALPEPSRQIFLLYRGEGLTMRAIAEQLDMSVRAVEKHIARAMLHCRNKLREAGRDI